MAKQPVQTPVCRSVFKSGESTTTERFTKKWLALVSQLEKSSGAADKNGNGRPFPRS